MKKHLFVFSLLLVGLMGCTEKTSLQTEPELTASEQARKKELAEYDGYSNIINYKTARYLAYRELADGANRFVLLPDNYELERIPRVIYDYENYPKYYEFGVVSDGKVVATVSTYAQKEDNCVIAYIFEGQRQVARLAGCNAFVGEYPGIYYGIKAMPGDQVSRLTTAEAENVDVQRVSQVPQNSDPWAVYYDVANSLDDENRTAMLATIEAMKQSPEYLELVEQEAEVETFWNDIEPLSAKLQEMNDNEINSHLVLSSNVNTLSDKNKPDKNGITGTPTSDVYVIPQYDNDNLKRTSWCTYCGPGAVAWVFRGLYDSYPISGPSKKYIPIHPLPDSIYNGLLWSLDCGTYSYYKCLDKLALEQMWKRDPNNVSRQNDNGFLEEIHSHTVKTGDEYPMYQLGLTNAIKSITNRQYGVQHTTAAHKHILNKHLPVFVNYTHSSGQQHWIVAFGYGKIGTKKYIYITDAGALIQHFGHKAYWRKETTANYGLRYKLVKK